MCQFSQYLTKDSKDRNPALDSKFPMSGELSSAGFF